MVPDCNDGKMLKAAMTQWVILFWSRCCAARGGEPPPRRGRRGRRRRRTVLALGDVERPVYPRSAVKALQALPLVESGAADRFGFGDEELALACASHGGEPGHVAAAARMLARAGLDAAALRMRRALADPSARRRRRWRAPAATPSRVA